jgi:hypothetical protein
MKISTMIDEWTNKHKDRTTPEAEEDLKKICELADMTDKELSIKIGRHPRFVSRLKQKWASSAGPRQLTVTHNMPRFVTIKTETTTIQVEVTDETRRHLIQLIGL